jgi:hypothetical protein
MEYFKLQHLSQYNSLREAHQKSGIPSLEIRKLCKKAGCNMSRPHTWLEHLRSLPYSEWLEDYYFS